MIYEYECTECKHVQEEIHGMNEKPEIKCEKCFSTKMQRTITGGSGFILKGDGFYSTSQRFKQSMIKKSEKQGKKAADHIRPVTKISDLKN